MSEISLDKLTPEQKASLAKQLADERKAEKIKRTQDLEALEKLAAEALPKSMEMLKEASKKLAEAKAEVYKNFVDYLKLKISSIGTKSNQQSHTISFGEQKIILGYRVSDGYTDEANYGIALVHKFLESCAKDDNSKMLVKSIMRLLQKNGKGDLDSKKVLELRQIANDYPNSDLDKGVDIIQNSYKPKMSKWFIESTELDQLGAERNVPLSITSVDLPEDIDLTFLLPKVEEKTEE